MNSSLDTLARDVRYALRALRLNPGFALCAVVSLALGLGDNTALFTLLDGVLFRDLAVDRPHDLVQLLQIGPRERSQDGAFSYPMFRRLRAARAVPDMTALAQLRVAVVVDREPGVVRAELVSGNFHGLLGVRAAAGRLLDESDDAAGRSVAVLSHSYRAAQNLRGTESGFSGSELFILVFRQNLLADELLPCGENGLFGAGGLESLTDRTWLLLEFRESQQEHS